jgi:drug/metabolite transporter (DMT)-like permease
MFDRKWHNRPVLGVACMLLGLALYPISDSLIKHLMGTYSIQQTAFLRGFTRLIPLLIAVFFQGGFSKVFYTEKKLRHSARLCVNLLYTYTFMLCFSLCSLTMVYTLSYTSSFFMIILSSFFLKESVSKEKWMAVVFGMFGVLLAIRPGLGLFEISSLLVLFGTGLGALNKVLMRKLAETEHSLAITIYPNLLMILVTAPFLIGSWQSMPLKDWWLFGAVGIITAGGQYAVAQALRFAQASTLAPMDYSSFLWVLSIDILWWHSFPDLFTMLGALAIVGSNIYILYCTKKEEKAKISPNTETIPSLD